MVPIRPSRHRTKGLVSACASCKVIEPPGFVTLSSEISSAACSAAEDALSPYGLRGLLLHPGHLISNGTALTTGPGCGRCPHVEEAEELCGRVQPQELCHVRMPAESA